MHWLVLSALLAAPEGPVALRAQLDAVSLSTWEGRRFEPPAGVWVVTVWSSGCRNCGALMKNIEALAQALESEPDVGFWGVDVDAFEGTPPAARVKAQKKLSFRFPMVEDPKATWIRTVEAAAQGNSQALPATVTVPAVYIIDRKGHVQVDLRHFRDTKPPEFVAFYRPLVEAARQGVAPGASTDSTVATALEDGREVGVSRGMVRLKFPIMNDSQISRALPDVKKQLQKMFPSASDAKLAGMLKRVEEAMKKGEPVEFESQ